MKDFNFYLDSLGEIGFVEELMHSLIYASGLPRVHPGELVLFEGGDLGQVFSLTPEKIEVLLLTRANLKVGSKLVRTDTRMQIPVGVGLLGRVIDPLGNPLDEAKLGSICIYAQIGQKQFDIKKMSEFFAETGIKKNTVLVASSSSDPAGVVFQTPYTAMTIAEYFRDKGLDVLLILDDMTTHARNYREISLLAKRFPGRA